MTNDIRAASERLRRHNRGEPGIYDPTGMATAETIAGRVWNDEGLLALQWLAEHPADDDEPISHADRLADGIRHALSMIGDIKDRHPEIPDEGWKELDAIRSHLIGTLMEAEPCR